MEEFNGTGKDACAERADAVSVQYGAAGESRASAHGRRGYA
jgi:hypothetical protein